MKCSDHIKSLNDATIPFNKLPDYREKEILLAHTLRLFYTLVQKNIVRDTETDLFCGKISQLVHNEYKYECSHKYKDSWKNIFEILAKFFLLLKNYDEDKIIADVLLSFNLDWKIALDDLDPILCVIYNKLKSICYTLGNYTTGNHDYTQVRNEILSVQKLLDIAKKGSGVHVPEHGERIEFPTLNIDLTSKNSHN